MAAADMLGVNPQIIAVLVFVAAYGAIISNKIHRVIPSIVGAVVASLLVIGDPFKIIHHVSWETLGLLFGMLIVTDTLKAAGFFRWIALLTIRASGFNPIWLMVLICLLTAVLSGFLSSIAVMAFMAVLTFEMASLLNVRPVPFIIAEIAASNIGGAATMVGDPPNVIMGTSLGYGFWDFTYSLGPIAYLALASNILFFLLWYRRDLAAARPPSLGEPSKAGWVALLSLAMKRRAAPEAIRLQLASPRSAIADSRLFKFGLLGFGVAVALFVTQPYTHLSLAISALIAAAICFVSDPLRRMPNIVRRIDWATIVFIAGLFLIVGGLEDTGVLNAMAEGLGNAAGGELLNAVGIMIWLNGVMSAVIDNVPMAATMAPIVHHLSASFGLDKEALMFSAAAGLDIGGNATPIGASANVVAWGVMEKYGQPMSWPQYLKAAIPATVIALTICTLLLGTSAR